MKYIIKSGSLYEVNQNHMGKKLVSLKSPFYTVKKTLLSSEGRPCLFTDIKQSDILKGNQKKTYMLLDENGHAVLTGFPGYAASSCLSGAAQSLSHAPRMDHIEITVEPDKTALTLAMLNSQNYRLTDSENRMAAEIFHNGIAGGWTIETEKDFSPFILMGLYIFSRYLDKENEFLVV